MLINESLADFCTKIFDLNLNLNFSIKKQELLKISLKNKYL